MKTTHWLLPVVATAFFVGAAAQAADRTQEKTDSPQGRALYRGTDPTGRIVQLSVADIGVPEYVRISTDASHARSPELHWSAKFGTGNAASLEH
jgi:hypothetical protein